MDQLDPTQRAAISRMHTDRLRVKLARTDLDEQQIAEMSREQLLDAWAKVVLAGHDEPQPAAATAATVVGYNVEVEKQRLELETRKFEAELAWRQAEAEREEARRKEEEARRKEEIEREEARWKEELDRERQREELRVAKEISEAEERKALYRLQEEELRIKQGQWEWQKSRDIHERERRETPAAQAKFFGDVLKNTMPKFPADVADIPIYFEGVEKIFAGFEVPKTLRAKLLLPHLSERAKSLLLRLDRSKQEVYEEVKEFLLNEFRLTPVQFKGRFERAVRNSDETYTMYCTRLKNLLTYYCRSRNVDDNYEKLFSLLVADKIKTTLPESCLDHVLTVEGKSWLACKELASTIDIYFANHTYEGRPKTLGFTGRQAKGNPTNQNNHPPNGANTRVIEGNNNFSGARPVMPNRFKDSKNGVSPPPIGKKSGLCFLCQSPGHRQADCPLRSNAGQVSKGNAADRVTTRNFACSVGQPRVCLPDQLAVCNTVSNTLLKSQTVENQRSETCIKTRQISESDGVTYRPTCDSAETETTQAVCATGLTSSPDLATTYRSARTAVSAPNNTMAAQPIADSLSKLNYVQVNIHGISGNHAALHDNGSEINLINRELLQKLPNLPTIGRIMIKGVMGPAVETDVAYVDISPAPSEANCVNVAPHLREVFAICDGLNENIILTADTVKRLAALTNYETLVTANCSVETDVDVSTDNNSDRDITVPNTDVNNHEGEMTNNDATNDDMGDSIDILHSETDMNSADSKTLIKEQSEDPALVKYFDMAKNGNGQFFMRDGILYRRGKVHGNKVNQLVLPQKRIETVLRIAHDLPASGHQAVRRTNDRIAMSFFFPAQLQRVKQYCDSCNICQLRARERRTDLVPIRPIDRHEENFGHLQADLIGPMGEGKYKYAIVLTDVQSRYVTAFELVAPTAKNVVDKIILHSSYFGLPRYISFDCGTHFTSELTKACLERLGVSPRFHCPYNPRAAGLVERSNATIKQIISKLAADRPNMWHQILPLALWSLRTSVNETLGLSPYQMVFGHPAIGPLQLLSDDWTGVRPLPLDIAKAPAKYMENLERKLQLASDYSIDHATREQARYTHNYNLKSRDKSFQIGERVVYLMPSSTQKLTRTWTGPCVVVKKNSPYSYIIEVNGKKQWCHANHLRKYNERVCEAVSQNCSIIFEGDRDFGEVLTLDAFKNSIHNETDTDLHVERSSDDLDVMRSVDIPSVSDDVTLPGKAFLNDVDVDNDDVILSSGVVNISELQGSKPVVIRHVNPPGNDTNNLESNLPSVKIDDAKLSHLSDVQKLELLRVLDDFPECFSETPGFCAYVEHSIHISPDFKPKRLREYRIPELLKPEIQRQIDELLRNGFIRPSTSAMASPIVAVLKGPSGKGGVRLAVDYRFVNSFSQSDALVMPHIQDTIQKVGASRYITVVDAKSGYWQIGIREQDRWLTAFAYDGGLYEWCRIAFWTPHSRKYILSLHPGHFTTY